MLAVSHVVFRERPPAHAQIAFAGEDYWICQNRSALPRAFVPLSVTNLSGEEEVLALLGSAGFDPRQQAALSSQPGVQFRVPSQGSANIVGETPVEVVIEADMKTPGILVLADRHDKGWAVTVNGRSGEILRVNYALRGVALPEGRHEVVFAYTPAGLRAGLQFAGIGALIFVCWAAMSLWKKNNHGSGNPA
ncbi:hypothetical protein EG834_08595 [bacterium]|nr:hypothetical protein [bacterium]